jgi:3'(2'), 5'-bisphosphate nucleotidase
MAEDLAAEHRDAAKLAEIAGRALVELRADPPSLRDLGAAGDRMAHQLLVAELNRLYPDDDVRSEEGLEHVAGTGRLWIIDPLDGTREFRQLDRSDWAVHVAMAVGGVAVVGAVALPALDLVLGTGEPPVLPPLRSGEPPRVVHAGGQYEWDSCAPVAVAVASGLHASRLDGEPLRYGDPDAWLPDLVVCRKEYAEAVLAVTTQQRRPYW